VPESKAEGLPWVESPLLPLARAEPMKISSSSQTSLSELQSPRADDTCSLSERLREEDLQESAGWEGDESA
jgi:hypothetical protein